LALTLDQPRVTLIELQTVYSLQDLYDVIEVGMVRAHNEYALAKWHAEQERRRQQQEGY
jgi:hypothetical protein